MRARWLCVIVVAVAAAAAYAGNVMATPSSGVTTTQSGPALFGDLDIHAHATPARLWRARIRTHGASDVYVVHNTFAPGATTGWHSHPGPSLILVTAGTVTNYESADHRCGLHRYSAGTGFVDAGGEDVHMLRNEGSEPAETLAVQILPHGADRKIDEPDPGNCHLPPAR
jgi:quercetin dioxygenase-like cupin family protein